MDVDLLQQRKMLFLPRRHANTVTRPPFPRRNVHVPPSRQCVELETVARLLDSLFNPVEVAEGDLETAVDGRAPLSVLRFSALRFVIAGVQDRELDCDMAADTSSRYAAHA